MILFILANTLNNVCDINNVTIILHIPQNQAIIEQPDTIKYLNSKF